MDSIQIRDDFIKLGQALKLAGLVDSGVEAKEAITSGKVKLNGTTELKRGKKIVDGDVVEYKNNKFSVFGKKA
ncbi:MAG: RNA-binding S4 domain-containing protein [Lachnospiraceae bacterium]|nr:RNA-binding S4 domain-containing protein [Lachnospiraceae bacterium]